MFVAIRVFLDDFLGPDPHNALGNVLAGIALISPFAVLAFLASFPFAAFGGVLFVAGFMADAWNWPRRLVPSGVAAVIGIVVGFLV